MALRNGEADLFMQLMQSLMAGTPYELIRELENHYQNVMFIITKLMGFYVQAEYRTSNGRIDLMVGTDKYVYIIELKFNGSANKKPCSSKPAYLSVSTVYSTLYKLWAFH
jgi:hypothetical protein